MTYVGIDVSKSSFVVAYSSEKGCKTKTFKNTTIGIHEFISTISKDEHHCVLEATGNYSSMLVYLLSKAGITTSLENPLKIKNFAKAMLSTVKTDEVDARMIALYGDRMKPAPYKLREEALLTLHQKRTVLRQLKKQLVATKNLKESFGVLPFIDSKCRKSIDKTISFLEKQIKEMEGSIASVAEEVYKNQMSLLTSIKGVGTALAAALIVATGGFTFFENAKQFTRYVGLSPTYQQSGTSVHSKGHINRSGDPYLRSQIYICAISSVRCNTECKACFERLRENGKPGKLAMTAVANKLIRQVFAVVKNETPYIDGFISEKM